jgi:hypothetical protein
MAFDVVNRSTFRATAAVAAREAEANQNIPAVAWTNGMNNGSCFAGLGVGYDNPDLYNNPSYGDGLLDGDPGQFTLLDQDEAVRVPQVSQVLGGSGLGLGVEGKGTEFLAAVSNPANKADGTPDNDLGPTTNGIAKLQTTAAGWVPAAI